MQQNSLKQTCDEIYKVNFEPYLSGRKDLFTGMLAAYLARGHVLIEGPPGTAKTMIAKLFARTFSKTFKRIQFTSDLLPAQVIGSHMYNQARGEYKFVPGPLFADIVLADEINRAPPRTQSAFLEAMEERQLSIEGASIELGDNFFVVATQNPVDYQGTYPLPEVQLDRFIFSFSLTASDEEQEANIVDKHMRGELPPPYSDMRTIEINFMELHDQLCAVTVPMPQVRYATALVRATRGNPYFRRGASLRAILAIAKGARMHAVLEGRDTVNTIDMKMLALPSLRHRVELSDKGVKLGKTVDQVVQEMVDSVPEPSAA